MTLALAAPQRSRRPVRRGWRATPERPFPTLGWLILDWTYAYLPSPVNEKKPLVYTEEQARRIIEWYRLDPRTGRFVHNRRLHVQEAKGFGKSPFAGSIDITEFRGPVCFDGWDADGQPVGVPWGTGDRPPPWIQIAAVSEAQTRNTYSTVYSMLAANNARAADELRIDLGRTRLYLRDNPEAILEPVTASAGTREGQRLTKATVDEPQLWTPANGGHRLVDTILGNLTKMSGRAVFTGNAYVRGEDSVAERFDVDEPGVLRYSRRPSKEPSRDMPREELVAGLREVYGDSHWIEPDRIVADAISPTADWGRAKRLFWNLPSDGSGANAWLPEGIWDNAGGDAALAPEAPVRVAVFIARDSRSAGIAAAQQRDGKMHLLCRAYHDGGEYLDVAPLEDRLRELHVTYPARVLTPQRAFPGAPEKLLPARGPEVVYSGTYFEGSAQRLRAEGMVLHYQPAGAERLAQAAATLAQLLAEQSVVHDADAFTAAHFNNVLERQTAMSTIVEPRPGQPAAGAFAAMVAVHRALTAPALSASSGDERIFGSFH